MFKSSGLAWDTRMYKDGKRRILKQARSKVTHDTISTTGDYDDDMFRVLHNPDMLKRINEFRFMPPKSYFQMFLEHQDLEVYTICYALEHAIAAKEIENGGRLLAQLESYDIMAKPGINRQYIISQKVQLMELGNHSAEELRDLVVKGIAETISNFNEEAVSEIDGYRNVRQCSELVELRKTPLVYEEASLFHALAKVYARMGKFEHATCLLESLWDSITLLNVGDRERERALAPALLSLIEFALATGKIRHILTAHKAYRSIVTVSATRHQGKYTLDFLSLYKKILPELYSLTEKGEGFDFVGDENENRKIAKFLSETTIPTIAQIDGIISDTKILLKKDDGDNKTSRVNKLVQLPPDFDGTLGGLLSALRKQADVGIAELALGICAIDELKGIEKGETSGNPLYLQAMFDRLGWDVEMFGFAVLSGKDYSDQMLRTELERRVAIGEIRQAKKLLHNIEHGKRFKKGLNRQSLERARTTIYYQSEMPPLDKYFSMAENALCTTCRLYDEDEIENLSLTATEASIINQIAGYCGNNRALNRAVSMYEKLRSNLNKKNNNNVAKVTFYAAIMYNYTNFLGKMGMWEQALTLIEEAMDFERDNDRFLALPGLTFNKAYCLYNLGKREESVTYVTRAYNTASIYSDYGHASLRVQMQGFANKKLGVFLS